MLLWQFHGELVQNLAVIALHCPKKGAISIHDQETKLFIILHQLCERLCVKFAVTQIHGSIDRFEGLKINGQFLLLVVLGKNFATKNDETIWRSPVVLLESLLGGSDGGQHWQTIDTRLDARGRAIFLRQHFVRQIDVLLRVQNQSDRGCPIAWMG